jgi:PAS domain S-box-containing protein
MKALIIAPGVKVLLTRVKDIMTRTSLSFFESDSLEYCIQTFHSKGLEGALVFNHFDELVGVVTEKDLLKGIALNYKTLVEIKRPIEIELEEEAKIRSIIHLKNELYPVKTRRNEICGFITRMQILESYSSEIQEDLGHLDAIFNSAQNGILSIDSEGYITSINPTAEKMAGTTREKAVGKPLNDIVAPSGLLEIVRTGKPHSEKYQVGKRKYITNRSPILRDGKVVGAVGVFQDISEIEFISQELSTVKNLLNELDIVLESSSDAILITDETGKIIKANQSLQRMLDLIQIPESYEALSKEHFETSIFTSAIGSKERVTVMEKNKKKNSLLMITGTPVESVESKIHRVVINIRDMTEIDNLRRELEKSQKHLSQLVNEKKIEQDFIARSPSMQRVMQTVHQIANVDSTVLIYGESGVGKEEIAKMIQNLSNRKDYPFIKVNCGAIPEQLLESELFGYEQGAFTGANKGGKKGLFEMAHQGTIFLDEIGELPLLLQVKLLRVLQEKELTRIGGVKPLQIDVRVIAATNQNLNELVEKGRFRKDLYYRLNVVPIQVPALSKRIEDIPLLIALFQKRFSRQYQIEKSISSEAMNALIHAEWPGNVRELANVIERLYVTISKSTIELKDINIMFESDKVEDQNNFVYVNGIVPLQDAVDKVEEQLIKKALRMYKNTRLTAEVLEVNQSTIVRKMKKFKNIEMSLEGDSE